MAERTPIGKKIRFEIFKRDKFTCQYCGRMAPDVILEVDHITPVAEGGGNDMTNLITSCRDCNRGKGKTRISDDAALKKQQQAIKELAEKREQMSLMVQWKKELVEHQHEEVNEVADFICAITGCVLSSQGKEHIRKLLARFSFTEVIEATEIAFNKYYSGDSSDESRDYALDKIGGICYNKRYQKNGEE